jgi:hypothetical protein
LADVALESQVPHLPKVAQAVELRHETLSSNPSTAKKKKKERKKRKKSYKSCHLKTTYLLIQNHTARWPNL